MLQQCLHAALRKLRYRNFSFTQGRLLVFVLCGILVSIDLLHIWQAHQGPLTAGRRSGEALAASLALQSESVMRTTEALLGGLTERLQADGWEGESALRLERLSTDQMAMLPWINLVAFYDRTGRMVIGSTGTNPGFNIADGDYFNYHQDHPDLDMRLGVPIISRFNQRLSIPATRRVNDREGHFAGVAVMSLDIGRMIEDYNKLSLSPHTTIAVFAPDGTKLLRFPLIDARIGARHPQTALGLAIQSGAPFGQVTVTSTTDSTTRLISFQRFFNGRLIMTVGFDRDVLLAHWWRSSLSQLGGLVALLALVVWLHSVLEKVERRFRNSQIQQVRRDTKRRMLAMHASDIVLEFDTDLLCREVGPTIEDVCGHKPEKLFGSFMLDMLRPVDRAAVAEAFFASLSGELRDALVTCVHHADGHTIWMEILLRRLEQQGEAPVILGVLRDVSAHCAAENREALALARLQNAHATLLRAERLAHVGHWRLHARTSRVTWSEVVARIYGCPYVADADENLSLDMVLSRIHDDDRERIATVIAHALKTGTFFQTDFRILRADDQIRHVCCFGEPDHDEQGEQVGIIGALQDVTERVRIENELRHEHKIKTIGRLAAGVAHDFNNLLQSITSCLELIQDDIEPDKPAVEYLRLALDAADRGSHLTHHLLSYARKQVLRPKRVLAETLLQDVRLLLERTVGPHIQVIVDIPSQLPDVEVDPSHLQTALLNLGINAGHAMPNGGLLTLQAEVQSGIKPRVIISVIDTGIGMDAPTVAQAVEPFFTTKGVKGTGLGLSMAVGFAHQSGGELRLFSKPGEGTRVELHLPGLTPTVTEAQPDFVARNIAGRRALLVEDASDVRITAAAFLSSTSMKVIAVSSGEQAVDQLAQGERFDIMITDYAMSGIDGVETIGRARMLQPRLPAIVITGYALQESLTSLPPGVTLLRKPFQRRDLIDMVQRALDHCPEPTETPQLLSASASTFR
jgi:PAS domain S-box-containing protein